MTYLYRTGGEAWPPRPPPGSATGLSANKQIITDFRKRPLALHEINFVYIPVADLGFPIGGGANPPGGAPRYDFTKFREKLHEIEKIVGRERGGAHLGTPPLIRHCIPEQNS